ncbi:hypothetical protein P3T39_005256 [Kitasatospora sp. GP82]|nr:hypothetical protein [Kitasatospora sp. GP82]
MDWVGAGPGEARAMAPTPFRRGVVCTGPRGARYGGPGGSAVPAAQAPMAAPDPSPAG